MGNFEQYSAGLLAQLNDRRVKNFQSLSERMLTFHSLQLWKLWQDNKEYERFKRTSHCLPAWPNLARQV